MDEIVCCERNSGVGLIIRFWDDFVVVRFGVFGGVWLIFMERSGRECRGWENFLRGEVGI